MRCRSGPPLRRGTVSDRLKRLRKDTEIRTDYRGRGTLSISLTPEINLPGRVPGEDPFSFLPVQEHLSCLCLLYFRLTGAPEDSHTPCLRGLDAGADGGPEESVDETPTRRRRGRTDTEETGTDTERVRGRGTPSCNQWSVISPDRPGSGTGPGEGRRPVRYLPDSHPRVWQLGESPGVTRSVRPSLPTRPVTTAGLYGRGDHHGNCTQNRYTRSIAKTRRLAPTHYDTNTVTTRSVLTVPLTSTSLPTPGPLHYSPSYCRPPA